MRPDFLRNLAEETGGRAFFPKRPEDLPAAFAQIEQELRAQYLVTYTPTNRARDGSYRRLQIDITNPQLKKQNLRLYYRQGYYAKTEQ
jgi:VWFA-related protein